MLNDAKKRELLTEAEGLVKTLRQEGAGRAEVSPVANVLLLAPGTWTARRAKAAQIAGMLPESWMKLRSKQMPRRLARVKVVLIETLEKHREEEDARFLLGWTLRLLKRAEDEERARRRDFHRG